MKSAIGRVLRGVLSVPVIRRAVDRVLRAVHPVLGGPQLRYAPPGHYESPLPDLARLDADYPADAGDGFDGIDLRVEAQRQLLTELGPLMAEFQREPAGRFRAGNGMFDQADAAVLYAMLRHFRPRRVVEVGSGFSSALMLDVNDRHLAGGMQLTFVEPYPDRLLGLLGEADRSRVRLLRVPVQQVAREVFDELEAGDVLFIDSSHVGKLGSDVTWLLFEVLPRLRPGVLVHVHDIFFPWEYPKAWYAQGRAWNELHLLRAFLQFNRRFEILLFNSFVGARLADEVGRYTRAFATDSGGSIWLRVIGER